MLANLWSIDMKLAVSAYSHVDDMVTSRFRGNSGLLGYLASSSLLAAIFVYVFVSLIAL